MPNTSSHVLSLVADQLRTAKFGVVAALAGSRHAGQALFRDPVGSIRMENQTENQMEDEMEATLSLSLYMFLIVRLHSLSLSIYICIWSLIVSGGQKLLSPASLLQCLGPMC